MNNKIIYLSIILSLVLLTPLNSGEGLWTSIGGPPGGYSRAADFCPPPFTEIYASSDSFLYVSTDNGQTWQATDHPQTEIYDIKIGRLGTTYCIFTATADGIYRCVDGGSWWLTNWQEPTEKLVIDRNNCGHLYAISVGKVIRSTNLGDTWIEITPQPPYVWSCIEIDPLFPQTIYTGSRLDERLGIWKSTNAGNDWSCIGLNGQEVLDITISPRNSDVIFAVTVIVPGIRGGIYKSTNGGANWYLIKSLAQECEKFQNLIISLPSPDTIFVIWDGIFTGHPYSAITYTYDEGNTWNSTPSHWPWLALADLVSSPRDDGYFIGTGRNGIVKFPNFLDCYSFSYTGLKPRLPVTLLTTSLWDDNSIICNSSFNLNQQWMWTVEQLWRSVNGGISWQVYPGQWFQGEYPIEPKVIRWVTEDSVFIIGYDHTPGIDDKKVYISPDKGISYSLIFSPPSALVVHFVNFDVFYGNTVYLIGNRGDTSGSRIDCYLWKSVHPYTIWEERSITPVGKHTIKIHPFNVDILFLGGNNGNFWKSTDGGRTLVLSNTGLPVQNNVVSTIATGFSTEDKPISIYCGFKKTASTGIAGLYKSTDLGATWHSTGLTEEINELKVDPFDPSILYISTPDNIYVSHDYGDHLLALNQGLNELKSFTIDLSTVRSHLFCGTRHGVFKFSPIRLFSGNPVTTGYQSSKIVIKDNVVYLAYQTLGGAYCGTSDMAGERKIRQFGMKDGEFPVITLDALNNPCAIWQRNLEPTPYVGGGELWFSRFDGTNWTEPYRLASFIGQFSLDVNLPSFTIDRRTIKGYVVFEYRDRFINGPNSHLLLGWFDILNPGSFQYTQLEVAPAPERCEFPSISLGGNYLYIAFQREHKIFRIKWDIINHQIVDRIQVSRDGRFSHHPFVDVQANGVINYVWEDSIGLNTDIYRRYELNDWLSDPIPIVETPGKSQWPQICKGTTWITWSEFIYPPTDNNWEICYKDMEYEGYEILSRTLEMSKYSHGFVIRSPYWPPPYEPKLTAIWTEGNQAPYEIRAKTVALPEIPFSYADAGREYPNPWTIQREGYIQFAPEPEKTIDYHSQKLIYRFPNLNPEKRYRIKLVFYFESQSQNRWRMKIDADNIFHANLWVKQGEITTLERWLPMACYKDGEIYLNITKIVGDYALVSQLFIYEYERETKFGDTEITRNTQESGGLSSKEPGLFVSPNPMHSVAVISYSLPANSQEQLNLKIYDASGRWVRLWDYQTIRLSDNIFWDGTDDNGKTLSNGIYFVVLDSGKDRLTRKLILLR